LLYMSALLSFLVGIFYHIAWFMMFFFLVWLVLWQSDPFKLKRFEKDAE